MKPSGKPPKHERLGIGHKKMEQAQKIHKNPKIVEKVKAQARKNEDIPTKTAVLNEIRYKKEIPDWTWGRYCKETGYAHNTPYKWFEKYNMPITKSFSAVGNRPLIKLSEDNPLRIHTNPDDKIQLNEDIPKSSAFDIKKPERLIISGFDDLINFICYP